MLIERARAKVNLTLRVEGRREDGYHDIASLVAFAGVADTLKLTPDRAFSLRVAGPTAGAAGNDDDNLVTRAAAALARRIPAMQTGAFVLTKRLPVAAGLGGGSADAAATLRLLARANNLDAEDPRVMDAAREVGADVPVCVASRARMMRGVGDRLGPPLRLPPLFAVLANPGAPVATAAIFARLGLARGARRNRPDHPEIAEGCACDALLETLRKYGNDLEDAAIVECPAISDVIAVLSAARGRRLARMSGSGATCFGLFATRQAALRAARVIRRDHPEWWAAATLLR